MIMPPVPWSDTLNQTTAECSRCALGKEFTTQDGFEYACKVVTAAWDASSKSGSGSGSGLLTFIVVIFALVAVGGAVVYRRALYSWSQGLRKRLNLTGRYALVASDDRS
jgi:hypothetical protein